MNMFADFNQISRGQIEDLVVCFLVALDKLYAPQPHYSIVHNNMVLDI